MRKNERFQTKQVVMAVGTAAFLTVLAGGAYASARGGALYASAQEGTLAEQEVPDASFTEADYDRLRELRFDGYEDLTVNAFQAMVWEKVDEPGYLELLERMSGSEALYEKKDEDALLHFLFYVLEPLTAERWQTRGFGGYVQEAFAESGQRALVEYNYTLSVTDANKLTVREYEAAQDGITKGMGALLKGKSKEELADAGDMQVFLDEEAARLKEQWSTNGLTVDVEYCFQPLELQEDGEYAADVPGADEGHAVDVPGADEEPRSYPYGTREDYRSLLALKTPDYQDLPVDTFNMKLLAWANENYDRMERIGEDTGRDDFQVTLSEEERAFVTRTVFLSGMENGKYVQSNYTGREREDVCYQESLPEKGGKDAWCDLYYTFTYHIANEKVLTVGERDRRVGGMIDDVRAFWEDMDLNALLQMEKAELVAELQKIAAQNSGGGIAISVNADGVAFEPYDERDAYDREPYDERDAYDRLVSYRTKDYEKMSVAEFNAALCDTEDEFGRLLDDNAQVAGTLSREDENYDFLENTMSVSLSELYCGKFKETCGRSVVLSRQERPYGKDEDGETAYAFWLYADLWVSYCINEPERLTVGERNHALQAMKDGLQDYIDGMNEEKLAGSNVKKLLERKGAELAKKLSDDRMKLWCEVQMINASWDERIL